MKNAELLAGLQNKNANCRFRDKEGVEHYYIPINPIKDDCLADSDGTVIVPRLIMRHTFSGVELNWITSTDIHSGWVIGIAKSAMYPDKKGE